MSTPPLIEIAEFLRPIAEGDPAGRDLTYEQAFDDLREARRSEDDTNQGDWQRKVKLAEWDRVIETGTGLLRKETKDLQIAAWVAEGLARKHGFAGLRDGLRLVQGLQDQFWDSYYPRIEDGDLDSRSGPFLFLNSTLPAVVRATPLTAGFGEERYSFLRWQESRATDNLGLKNPDQMAAMVAEGKITGKQFDDQVAQTPRRFYEELAADLTASLEAFRELDQSTDRHFGRDAPGLGTIRKAIEEVKKTLEPILAAKRAQEPDPEEPPPVEIAESEAVGTASDLEAPAPQKRQPTAPRGSGGPIASVADAHQRIVEAAAYLRQNEPSSPVPFLVVRALRAGEVHGLGNPPDPAQCEAPQSDVRQTLRRLAAEGAWPELLEQAEQAVGRPEGRAWLDLHRFTLKAISETWEPDRSAAAAAIRSWLRGFLADFPSLPDAELNDGTPTASAETRAWIKEEKLNAVPGPPPSYAPPPASEPAQSLGAEPDVWDQALEAVRGGRVGDGLQMIRRAMTVANSGRERFLRKLQLAELCLLVNNHRVALPLSEDLARQVDEYHLEQWEDEQLAARVWAALYRCLRHGGAENGSAEKLQQVFTRLCRLDINQALLFGEDRPTSR